MARARKVRGADNTYILSDNIYIYILSNYIIFQYIHIISITLYYSMPVRFGKQISFEVHRNQHSTCVRVCVCVCVRERERERESDIKLYHIIVYT